MLWVSTCVRKCILYHFSLLLIDVLLVLDSLSTLINFINITLSYNFLMKYELCGGFSFFPL